MNLQEFQYYVVKCNKLLIKNISQLKEVIKYNKAWKMDNKIKYFDFMKKEWKMNTIIGFCLEMKYINPYKLNKMPEILEHFFAI